MMQDPLVDAKSLYATHSVRKPCEAIAMMTSHISCRRSLVSGSTLELAPTSQSHLKSTHIKLLLDFDCFNAIRRVKYVDSFNILVPSAKDSSYSMKCLHKMQL